MCLTKPRGLNGARYYKRTDQRYKDGDKLVLFKIKTVDMHERTICFKEGYFQ